MVRDAQVVVQEDDETALEHLDMHCYGCICMLIRVQHAQWRTGGGARG